jgi:hypothetical protein
MSSSALQHKASLMQRRLLEEGARYVISRWPRSRCRGNYSRKYYGGSMDCDRGQPHRSNWSGCVITTEGVYLNAGKNGQIAGSDVVRYGWNVPEFIWGMSDQINKAQNQELLGGRAASEFGAPLALHAQASI